jgi:hypothetical protein
MNDEARSAKVYKSQAHVLFIDQHPLLGNLLLLLSLVSLFCICVFLLSDILSIGADASHKGIFDGFNSEKNIAEFAGMITQKYNDMKVLLGFRPEGGQYNPSYSNSPAEKNGTLLTASGVLNSTKNGSSSLSSITASSANISKMASSGSRYVIPRLGDDSSSDESPPPKKMVATSRKNANQTSLGVNQSQLGLFNQSGTNQSKNSQTSGQQPDNIKDKRTKVSSNISKDNVSLSNAPFALSDILSDHSSAGVISPEKASYNLTAADYSTVRTLEFELGSKDRGKDGSKITAQTQNKIKSRSKAPSKPKDGKSVQSNKRIRAVRIPQKQIPHTRPKISRKSSI